MNVIFMKVLLVIQLVQEPADLLLNHFIIMEAKNVLALVLVIILFKKMEKLKKLAIEGRIVIL